MDHWPHAPAHHLGPAGTFMVTCGTYQKEHVLHTPERLAFAERLLLDLVAEHGWEMQAWAVLSNHYHFAAHSPQDSSSLRTLLSRHHSLTAREFNKADQTAGRRVWYDYFETRITFQRSYLARLNYVHQNAVHHGLVCNAVAYPWCSAAWFEARATQSFRSTVESFKLDKVRVEDEYAARMPAQDVGTA